jgi:uncharacterized protein
VIVIGDTSGVLAAINRSDPDHEAARESWRHASVTVIAPLVFAEVEHVMTNRKNRQAAWRVNDWLLDQVRDDRVRVVDVSARALRRARAVQNRYVDLRLDLTDAVNVVLAERYETEYVLTLDRRDFRAVRPLTGHDAFVLLPDDF